MNKSKKISFKTLNYMCVNRIWNTRQQMWLCCYLLWGTDTKQSDSRSALEICGCSSKNCPAWKHNDERVVALKNNATVIC